MIWMMAMILIFYILACRDLHEDEHDDHDLDYYAFIIGIVDMMRRLF